MRLIYRRLSLRRSDVLPRWGARQNRGFDLYLRERFHVNGAFLQETPRQGRAFVPPQLFIHTRIPIELAIPLCTLLFQRGSSELGKAPCLW